VLTNEGQPRWPLVIGCTLGVTTLWVLLATLSSDLAAVFPIAAAVVCGGIYLIWQAALRKKWALLTLMIVGPTLLSMTFRKRDIGNPGLDWQVALKAVGWIAMFAVSAANVTCIKQFLADRAMTALGCLCILIDLSTLYSPAPLVTGPAAFSITVYFGFSCLLANEIPERTLLLWMFWGLALTCLVNVLSSLVVPDMAFGEDDATMLIRAHHQVVEQLRFQGLFGQPNILARYVSVFVFTILAVAYRGYVRPLIWLPNALLAAGILFTTHSRGTILAVVAGLLVVFPRRHLVVLCVIAVTIGVAIYVSGQQTAILALVGRNGDADEALDMAGRAGLWQFVWEFIKQRPLLGYGFNSFEVYAGPFWTGQAQAGVAAHNNYLSMLFTNGIFGTIPFALIFMIFLHRWWVKPDLPRDFFVLSTLVYGYAEIDMPSFNFVPSQLFFTMMALDAKQRLLLPSPATDKSSAAATTDIHMQEAVL
jgi:O-antigen ligase